MPNMQTPMCTYMAQPCGLSFSLTWSTDTHFVLSSVFSIAGKGSILNMLYAAWPNINMCYQDLSVC